MLSPARPPFTEWRFETAISASSQGKFPKRILILDCVPTVLSREHGEQAHESLDSLKPTEDSRHTFLKPGRAPLSSAAE